MIGRASTFSRALILAFLACLLETPPAAAQTAWIVDDDGQGTAASCDDSQAAFSTVGAAVAAAVNGDTVLVCPGTYYENINFGGKAIAVRSVAGSAVTILDGNLADSVVTFASGEGASSSLEGFTIRNGNASFSGGGVRISSASPVIRRNVIVRNRACSAPGIYVNFGSPLIEENTIAENFRAGCSGGTGGGGIAIVGASMAMIRRNIIRDNSGLSMGGGISLWAADSPTIEFNVIVGNSAEEGGGIAMANQSDATIVGNLIAQNRADEGGGIHWLVPSGSSGPLLVNNTIAGNESPSGSGIFADGYDAGATLFNNIIVAAAGQTAVFCENSYDLTAPVFRSNNVFSATGAAYGGVCADQTGANGNISADPLFTDPAAGDYHLGTGSPAIDAGESDDVGVPSVDLDGHARILDGNSDGTARVDIGADEAPSGPPAALPGAFGKVSPVDGSLEQPLTVVLQWAPSGGATSYEYCYDTVDNDACDGTWLPAWNETAVTVLGLLGGTTYYWQVRATNSAGTTYADDSSSSHWTLTTTIPPITRIIVLSGDLAFGTQEVGWSRSQQLTIRNTGNAALTVRDIICPTGFTASWAGTIPAGELQRVSVTFSPPSPGLYVGTIEVVADHTSGTNTIGVSGTAISRVIGLAGDLAFGNVVLGTSVTRTLTIANTGTSAVTVYSISYPTGFSGAWSGTIQPGAFQDVTVVFSPTAIKSYGGTVWVSSNKTDGENEVTASGAGVLAQPVVAVHPMSVVVVAGLVATFRADATGEAPVGVQWQRSIDSRATWSDIPGATATTYALTARRSESGTYFRAVFSNPYGTAITSAALLTALGRPGDFEGDGRTEIAVRRPSTGEWFTRLSSTAFASYWWHAWGEPTDVAVPADYDGDGRTDIAVWRPTTGQWFVRSSSTEYANDWVEVWGVIGDVPVPADFDGDGRAEIAAWRPSTGQWFIRLSTTGYGTYWSFSWGLAGDRPITADFDGDGRAEIGIWRPSNGRWYLRWSTSNFQSYSQEVWGNTGDTPLAGDYDGDGRAEFCVWRPSEGRWYIRWSASNWATHSQYAWGLPDDIVMDADLDGDGLADLVAWRPSTGEWFVLGSASEYTAFSYNVWGLVGDVPVIAR